MSIMNDSGTSTLFPSASVLTDNNSSGTELFVSDCRRVPWGELRPTLVIVLEFSPLDKLRRYTFSAFLGKFKRFPSILFHF